MLDEERQTSQTHSKAVLRSVAESVIEFLEEIFLGGAISERTRFEGDLKKMDRSRGVSYRSTATPSARCYKHSFGNGNRWMSLARLYEKGKFFWWRTKKHCGWPLAISYNGKATLLISPLMAGVLSKKELLWRST
jgi:hypothetical protein